MNCIFNSFNKKEAVANPFLQPNRNDPGKFIFPTGSTLAQAAQAQSGCVPGKGQVPSFSFANATSGVGSFIGSTMFSTQTLFPSKHPQFSLVFAKDTINTTPQTSSVKLTKYTSKITNEKVIALLSSEYYVKNEDITVISQLNPTCDAKDVTKVAPLAAAAFVDESTMPLTQLPKIHVKFLQELVLETVKTEEDVWKCAIGLATSHGMYSIVQIINATRPYRTLTIQQQQITPEIAFVMAVHAFVTNNDRPHDVMTVSKRYSKDVAKLAADMCMASYGLRWILKTQTQDYISKHKNTYILSC